MKINDYIIRGGENLNSSPIKTSTFPTEAENIFAQWHSKLGKDDEEKEEYLEVPIDSVKRLFIKSFWIEKAGQRPICYYVGLIIPRELYLEAKDYYRINKGLSRISFAEIQSAAKSSFSPIAFSIDFPLPRTAIGLEFQQLSQMKLYGEKEFDANINQMCFSISINNIDDWFSRLLIAVNPYRLQSAYHIIVSRDEPRPMMRGEQQKNVIDTNNKINHTPPRTSSVLKPSSITPVEQNVASISIDSIEEPKNKSKVLLLILFAILIVTTWISIHHFSLCREGISHDIHYALQDKHKSLEDHYKELSSECEKLSQKNARLQNESASKDKEIQRLNEQIIQLNQKLSTPEHTTQPDTATTTKQQPASAL